MDGAMDLYRCVDTLTVPPLAWMYTCVQVKEGGRGAAEVTSIGALLIFFHTFSQCVGII